MVYGLNKNDKRLTQELFGMMESKRMRPYCDCARSLGTKLAAKEIIICCKWSNTLNCIYIGRALLVSVVVLVFPNV